MHLEMPIALVPPDEPVPVTPAEEPSIKRGRGRPPGSKNKPKLPQDPEPPISEPVLAPSGALPVEPIEDPPEELPIVETPEGGEESPIEEEPDEPPPPPKPRARTVTRKAPPPPPPTRERKPRKAPQRPETPPESPRTAKSRLWGEYREAQASAHAQRRDHFSGLLGRFMR